MTTDVTDIIIGQGLAGSAVAWRLHWAGRRPLIIDRGEPATASRVSAGLMTPMTGKRLVQPDEFHDTFHQAVDFYRQVESETGEAFLDVREMARLFENAVARDQFLDRSGPAAQQGVANWDGTLLQNGRPRTGITMKPAARLAVLTYLEATQKFFAARQAYRQHAIDFEAEVEISPDSIRISSLGISAPSLVICQGAAPNHLFPCVPNNPSRGDILRLHIDGYICDRVVHRSIWIAPNKDGTQSVGATYDWDNLKCEPSEEGREQVLGKLSRVIHDGAKNVEHTLIDHQAAVRPTMKDYQPVVGRHANYANVTILNGLGSKGSLRAPSLANDIVDLVTGRGTPDDAVNYARLVKRPPKSKRIPLVTVAQEAVAPVIRSGDTVIDATVGNGFDTCFLANAVGETGSVIGYDVQDVAIEATNKRLAAQQLSNVDLRLQSHAEIATLAQVSVSVAMFNLGYLPRAEHFVTTKSTSTIIALEAVLSRLRPGGMISILCYRGHEGGPEESAAVMNWLERNAELLDTRFVESTPPKPTSPILVLATKHS